VQRLEKARELRKQLDEINTSIVADVSAVPATGADGKLSHGSISSDDEDDISDDGSLSTDQENRVAGYAVRTRETRQELPWTTKATIIFFHLHPWLGNKNFEVTSKVHSCNSVTLGGWLRKRDRILKWIDIVTGLTFNDALKAIPEQHRNKYESTLNPPYPPLDLKAFMNKIKTVKCRVAILHKNSKGTAQNSAAYAKKSKQAVYIRASTKRIRVLPLRKPPKHLAAKQFVAATIKSRWNQGLAITKTELRMMVLTQFAKEESFMNVYGNKESSKSGLGKLNTFLARAIKAAGFSVRESTISQKVPLNWRTLAEAGAQRVRETFQKAEVDVVVAADETFIRFHEEDSRVLAPVGEARIGKAVTCDGKSGCTVLPTMDMLSSQLLPPLIIFNGVFGGRLMTQWQEYTNSLVLFTEKHWMTTETMVLYFKWLMSFYKGKTVGVIIDHAPSHTNDALMKWVEVLNEQDTNGTKLVVEWVDKGLTSIYQPGDISVNKPLKAMVKQEYYRFITENQDAFTPGEKIKVPRERLVSFIENAFHKVNDGQRKKRMIAASFRTCGLDPFATDLMEFTKHLDHLSESQVYNKLLEKNAAVKLDETHY
jgi:hypothetical protein